MSHLATPIALEHDRTRPQLRCLRCGANLRLVGVEGGPGTGFRELWTYECTTCGQSQVTTHEQGTDEGRSAMWVFLEKSELVLEEETVNILVGAFDDAWARLLASGVPIGDEANATVARERLAKSIIEAAKAGERDQRRLREDALLHFSRASLRASVA
jgi:hypothetical protein